MISHSRRVYCHDCPKVWRYGCHECAIEFADYHREAFGHDVTVRVNDDNDHWRDSRSPQANVRRLMGRGRR